MHIPDGILDTPVLVTCWVFTLIYGGIAIKKIKSGEAKGQVAIQGVLTAMVFAFQMLNFPILAGTSGHLLGFVLMAILTSPTAAFVMISTILIIQAVLFADGGILALGANIFNMGIVPVVGYFVYRVIRNKMGEENEKGLLVGAFLGAFTGVVLAALACGIEIGVSSKFPYGLSATVPAMLGYHVLIGIGEGLITMFVIAFFNKYSPEYIPEVKGKPLWY